MEKTTDEILKDLQCVRTFDKEVQSIQKKISTLYSKESKFYDQQAEVCTKFLKEYAEGKYFLIVSEDRDSKVYSLLRINRINGNRSVCVVYNYYGSEGVFANFKRIVDDLDNVLLAKDIASERATEVSKSDAEKIYKQYETMIKLYDNIMRDESN